MAQGWSGRFDKAPTQGQGSDVKHSSPSTSNKTLKERPLAASVTNIHTAYPECVAERRDELPAQ